MPLDLKLENLRVSSPLLTPASMPDATAPLQLLHIQLDMPGTSANVLTTGLFDDLTTSLDSIAEAVAAGASFDGLIVQSLKPRIFVAGADLKNIFRTLDWPDERIIQFCQDGKNIFARLQQFEFPSVAAVNGACVGGGFELALWCDARVALDDRSTFFGLPEVKLGLVPGWAGTCILPRLVGTVRASDWTALAKNIAAAEACEAGAVDAVVVPPSDAGEVQQTLFDAAVEEVVRQRDSTAYLRRRQALQSPAADTLDWSDSTAQAAYDRILVEVESSTEVDNHAGKVVLDQVLNAGRVSLAAACQAENIAMTRVYGSPTCSGLLNNFFLNEHARKSAKQAARAAGSSANLELKTVGIVGAGQMGSGLARLLAQTGRQVLIHDRQAAIAVSVAEAAGPTAEPASDLEQLAGCDLIVESIAEDLNAKQQLLEQLSRIAAGQAILASNTSMLPLHQLATSVQDPTRFAALHFCSPVIESPLAEVGMLQTSSLGPGSADATVAALVSLIGQLKKTAIVVKDSPGLIVNRLLQPLLDQALRLATNGLRPEQVDRACREFGWRLGPFQIMDLIGVDIVVQAGKASELLAPGRLLATPLLPRMVKHGWLGLKSGGGFYDTAGLAPRPAHPVEQLQQAQPNPQVEPLLAEYTAANSGTVGLDNPQIVEKLLLAMLVEAEDLLDAGIALDPRDVDLCLIQALGFPADRGGLLYWASQQESDWLSKTTADCQFTIRSADFSYTRWPSQDSSRDETAAREAR